MGRNFIPHDQEYDIRTFEFDLEDVTLKIADSLSGYSNRYLTFGSIIDEEGRLSTRSGSITLVPLYDTLDYGTNPEFDRFYLTIPLDTISAAEPSQANIIQNVNVYELSERIKHSDGNIIPKHYNKKVTRGVPVFSGGDSLTFDFSDEFAAKYMNIKQEDLKDIKTYLDKYPGILFQTDNPLGQGGRFNIFHLQLNVNGQTYGLTGSYANLTFSSEYNGVRKDTNFIFYFGPDKIYDADSLLTNGTIGDLPQYAFNATTQEGSREVGDKIYIEGGGSAKPVISAAEIKKKLIEEVRQYGDYSKAFIHKASIILPFEFPEDYTKMDFYPEILNPTCRIDRDTVVNFASLTNSASVTENMGYVDRSHFWYSPDISYHVQEVLRTADTVKLSNYDIWLMIMKTESYVTSSVTTEEDYQNYYQNLMYANYYSGMYSGYGNYGYGSSYGNYGYSNYISYQLASQYLSDNSTTQSAVMLDNNRFYKAVLYGPQAEKGKRPRMKILYSVPIN